MIRIAPSECYLTPSLKSCHSWKWYRSAASLLLIVILNTVDFARATEAPIDPILPTARIYLFSFERGPLLDITDTPNTDVVLTKEPAYFQAYMFECNATFPIQWAYIGEGAPIMTADVGRIFANFYDTSTYRYQAAMIMFALEERNSGRYVCRGIEAQNQKTSVYFHLYVPGSNILVSTADKSVQIAPYKDQIILPCSVSDPTAQVNLYKGNRKGVYKRIETNSSITYNPRKGFKIQRKALQDPMGKYLCIADSSKRRVRIHVLPKGDGRYENRKKRQTVAFGEPDLYGVQQEAIEFAYDNRYHRMLCCSRSAVAPKLTFAGCTSIVDCEIKSACFREGQCEAREHTGVEAGYFNKYMGLDPPGCTGHSLRDDPNGDMGLFLCQDSITSSMIYQPFQLNRGNLFMSFLVAPSADQVMTLERSTSEELFPGSETQFRCNSSRFFFGYGVRWAFERNNGDLEFVADDDVVNDLYFVNNHRRHTTLRIPDANIKSVICAAPVWNHPTEWRMLSLPITVSRVFVPSPSMTIESSRELVYPGEIGSQLQYSPPEDEVYTQLLSQETADNTLKKRVLPGGSSLLSYEDAALLKQIAYATQQSYIIPGTNSDPTAYPESARQDRYYSPEAISKEAGSQNSNRYYYSSEVNPRVRRKTANATDVENN